jgi:hypothetical protein
MIRVFPLTGVPKNIIGGYGPRTVNGVTRLHDSVDLAAPIGTPVVAVDDGMVRWGTDPIGGNVAILTFSDGSAVYMAHLLDAQSGQRQVRVGNQIGRCDTTGNAALVGISHVHFQVWPGGQFGPPGTVHPNPTDDLMAADVLSAPTSRNIATSSNLGLATLGGVAILGAAGLVAWGITENKHHAAAAFSRENPSRCRASSEVQSLLFQKNLYTPAQAKRWAVAHGFKPGKMDVTGKYIHLTQAPSSKFRRIRTVPFGRGIISRVGWTQC